MALSLRRVGTSRVGEGRIVPGPAPLQRPQGHLASAGPRPSKVQ